MAKASVFDNGGYIGRKATFGESIGNAMVTSSLKVYLDAASTTSAPNNGTWYDLSGNNYNFTIQGSAPLETSGGIKYYNFEGSSAYATSSTGSDVPSNTDATLMVFSTIKNSTGDWRTLIRGARADHQVIVYSGNNALGMYDNDAGGFQGCSFDITSLPSPYTQFNCLTWRFARNSSPYYRFSYNGSATTYNITSSYASFTEGIYYLGGAGSQQWGKLAVVLYYHKQLTDAEVTQNYNFFKARFGI